MAASRRRSVQSTADLPARAAHALAKAGCPAHIGRMRDPPTRDAGFGVYVHWPFCLSKCPYCDFNSHVRDKGVDEARFLAAFRREIAHMAALAPGRTVTSVFFGGGTPSLMAPATTAALLDAVAAAWTVAPDAEITLEANPTSVEATRFAGYRSDGGRGQAVCRLSAGGRQPGLAGRAGAERCGSRPPRAPAHGRRGARRRTH